MRREQIIEQSLALLAGPGQPMTMLMVVRFLQKTMSLRGFSITIVPDWRGSHVRNSQEHAFGRSNAVLDKVPGASKAIAQAVRNIDLAVQFYVENKDSMNDGAVASWEQRVDEGMVDAVHTAMDVGREVRGTFWCELMNQPQM